MQEFLQLAGAALAVMAVALLAMAVGVIIRNKSFTSCGCASIRFRGETIRCPACPSDGDDDRPAASCDAEKPDTASTA
jgi:hypothetical protein